MIEQQSSTEAQRKTFESIGWGLIFLLLSTLAWPGGTVQYAGIAGVGALLLALNVAILRSGRQFDLFTTVLGATALLGGAAALGGLKLDLFAVFFGVLGVVVLAVAISRPALRRG